jgi:5-methyltetrahydropteroyltriglutamate--homocysteine methyltransferase
MKENLPLIPTSVIGSHAIPSWLWTALEAIEAGKYGQTDKRELFDDAVSIAIRDMEQADIDVISDGEMKRWYFVQSFYEKMEGIEPEEALRKVGLYAYDSVPRYRLREKVTVPHGLGVVEEFKHLKTQTDKPVKATCPGPLTVTIHLRDSSVREFYKDRMELFWQFAEVVNQELKDLVKAGADYIQLDEPSFAIIPGQMDEFLALYNRCVEGVDARIAFHICFGNLMSRPRGKREYGPMVDYLLKAKCDEFVLEFANREMHELELCQVLSEERDIGVGVIDIKSFYRETPNDVADRIRAALQYIPPEKLWVVPDCGFFQLPRWITVMKLRNMVAGTRIVRQELTGSPD